MADESKKSVDNEGKKGSGSASLDEMIDRKWGERANAMTQVRKKLRSGWRNDDAVLEQYFNSCDNNWKVYTGPRTLKQTLKLQALYKQATTGDAPESAQFSMEEEKYVAWKRLKGMDQKMAKRRYITFLAEISPLLIDVMPDEKPPDGFPLDRHGHLICAKCNTTVGCARPLLDNHNTDLRQQLFEREELHDAEALKVWVRNALLNQRCIWGLHMPISKAQSREFVHWFDRPENKGFHAYDSSTVMQIVRELVVYQFEVTYDMMQNKSEYSVEDYNDQAIRAIKLREVYMQLSGEIFEFEVPCNRTSHQCNEQRLADGGKNHTHVVEIDPPSRMDVASFKEAVELRTQCQALGLNPVTGVVTDIEKRCQIYRDRLAEHFKALEKANEAKKRNIARPDLHKEQKQQVIELSTSMMQRQLWDACHTNRPDRVLILVKRGADPNDESPRGLTPLLCFILCEATVELVEELIGKRADINYVNKYGITPLMMACKLRSTKVVHMLMRLGAFVLQHGGKVGRKNSAMHWAAVHGAEDEAKIIIDHVRDSAGDSLRVSRCIDAQNEDGETPLMYAVYGRNGVMCRLLVGSGASTNIRNKQGRTAAYLARHCGWTELADWLDTKLGSGVAKIETFSDLNYDKKIRYGTIKLRDMLLEFGKNYLIVMQKKSGKHNLLPPSIIQQYISENGDSLIQQQQKFVNTHQLIVHQRNESNREELRDKNNPSVTKYVELLTVLPEMLSLISKGLAAPNLDVATNPMSLTALIAAAMVSDVRSMRLLVREGADINGRNRYGTTPLMFASQLNNIEACIELLTLGADLSITDNFGFTALAYSNSLPLPTAMARNSSGVIMDDDIDGTKPLCAADILKTAAENGIDGLREMVQLNAQQSHPDTIELNYTILRLLEQYGLTQVYSESQVALQAYTSEWRITESCPSTVKAIKHDEDDSTDAGESKGSHQQGGEEEDDAYSLRCPMCTLMLPCSHFFKGAVLRRYFQRLKEQKEAEAKGLTGGSLESGKQERKKSPLRLKGLKVRDKTSEILEETGINDRETDRSFTLAQKYRARELQLEREREAIENARVEAERKAKIKEYAIARGTWVEWREVYNTKGELEIRNEETEEVWVRYFDKNRNPYYYNAATNESRWIAPNRAPKPVSPSAPLAITTVSSDPAMEKKAGDVVVQSKSGKESIGHVTTVAVSAVTAATLAAAVSDRPVSSQAVATPSSTAASQENSAKMKLSIDTSIQSDVSVSPSPSSTRITKSPSTSLKSPSTSMKSPSSNLPLVSSPRSSTAAPTSVVYDASRNDSDENKLRSILKSGGAQSKRSKARRVFFALPGEEADVSPVTTTESPSVVGTVSPNPVGSDMPSTTTNNNTINSNVTAIGDSDTLAARAMNMLTALSSDMDDETEPTTAGTVTSQSPATTPVATPAISEPVLPQAPVATPTAVTVDTKSIVNNNPPAAPLTPTSPKRRSPVKKSDLIGENPVPVNGRRVLAFTSDLQDSGGEWDALSASHHYTASPLVHSLTHTNMSHEQAEKEIGLQEEAKAQYDLAKAVKNKKDIQFQPICLSGWIFVGLSVSKPGPPPIEFVQVTLNMWATVLDHIRTKFMDDWLPEMRLEPAVDLSRTAVVAAPRCSVCKTGFVRVMSQDLCLQCLMRQELFEKIKPCLPRSFRARNPMRWPFNDRSDVEFNHSPQKSSQKEYFLPASINLKGLGGKGSSQASGVTVDKPASASGKIQSSKSTAVLEDIASVPATSPTKSSSQRQLSSKSNSVAAISTAEANSAKLDPVRWDGAVDWFQRFDHLQDDGDEQFALARGAGVKDLPLLPYLVAKGHMDDLERTVRACFHQAGEADSLQILPRLLAMQAEAYKLLGMWPLALALMMDRADMLATITGYENVATITAVCHVASCLRKMGCGHLASVYIKSICRRLEQKYQSILGASDNAHNWRELSKDLVIADNNRQKERKKYEKYWKNAIFNEMPQRETRRRTYQSLGLGGLYQVMSTSKGHGVAIRLAFEAHCVDADPVGLGKFATFVSSCMQLRCCDDWEVFQHLLHEILHKQLAQSLIHKSEVARLYLEVTPYEHQAALSMFLKRGTPIDVQAFDELLLVSLKALAPEYSSFFRNAGSALFRQHLPSFVADAEMSACTMIQTSWRVAKAYKRLKRLRKAHTDHILKQKEFEFS